MIWQALPYVIGGLILLNLLFVMFLLGLSAWECYRDDQVEEDPQTAWEEMGMDTLHDPAALIRDLRERYPDDVTIPVEEWSIYDDETAIHHRDGNPLNNQPDNLELVSIRGCYRTNYGRRMRGDR